MTNDELLADIRDLSWKLQSVARRLVAVIGPSASGVESADETAYRAAERLKLYEQVLRVIVRASYGEFRWGMPEAGRIAEEALQGKDTFLNMLVFQREISRQRQRDESGAVSRQAFDEFAEWVKGQFEMLGEKAKK